MDTVFSTGVTDDERKPIFLTYRQVGNYVNEQFFQAYSFYMMVKLLEPYSPYPGGWIDWPEVAVIILRAINLEQKRIEQEETP